MQTDTIQPVTILTPSPTADAVLITTPVKPAATSSTLTIPSSLPSSTRSSPLSSTDASESDISDDEGHDDVFQDTEEYSGDLPTPSLKPAATTAVSAVSAVSAAAPAVAAVPTSTVPVTVSLPETHIEPVQLLAAGGLSDGVRGMVLSDSTNSVSSAFSSSDEPSMSTDGRHSRHNSDSYQRQQPLSVGGGLPSRNTSAPLANAFNISTTDGINSASQPLSTSTLRPVASTPHIVITPDTATSDTNTSDELRGAPPPLRKQLTIEMLESPQHQQALKNVTPPQSAPPSPQRTAEARSTLGLNFLHRLFHSLSPQTPATPQHAADAHHSHVDAHHPQHATIKVKTKQKSTVNVLTGVHETQRLDNQHVGPIWAITIAPDGSYIATGGQDSVLRLWPLQPVSPHLSAPPIALSGHKSDIIDVSFSPSHFILSASIDHTVRLWHPSRNAALSIFQHPDFVTAVHFNPLDDRTFASVCFDRKVRVWSIVDHRVVEWTKVSELCTACRYDRTGRYILVGTHVGTVAVIRASGEGGGGLKYVQELNCRNRSGKYKKGKKVTGIDFFGHLMVVTTNDSRLRIFDMNDETDVFTLVCKLKGVKNDNLQIKGKFNDDGTLVLCGSDDGQIAVWQVPPQIMQPASRRLQVQAIQGQQQHDKPIQVLKVSAREQFQAMVGSVATCAQFLPRKFCNDQGVHHVIVAASSGGEVKLFEDRRM